MATRRANASKLAEKDGDYVSSTDQQAPSDITPAVPSAVIAKLLGFTFAMVTFPLGAYFLSVDMLFKGNSTYAGAFAAIMANVVLIGYVIVAMNEDKSDQIEAAKKGKKAE